MAISKNLLRKARYNRRRLESVQQTPIEQYAKARRKYKPRKIKILFVAESPPSSGGFFYFDRTIGKDHLFRETMKALQLWPIDETMTRGLDKRPLLNKFRSKSFFLIDTCDLPVDKLSPHRRRLAIVRESSKLADEAKRLDPDHILIVKKTVFRPVREALVRVGLANRILNDEPIPFPSHGNQACYRSSVSSLVRRVRARS